LALLTAAALSALLRPGSRQLGADPGRGHRRVRSPRRRHRSDRRAHRRARERPGRADDVLVSSTLLVRVEQHMSVTVSVSARASRL